MALVTAEAFWNLLAPLLVSLKIAACRQVAFLGDGARWILDEAKARFPNALGILDFYHAAEHVHDTSKALFGANRRATTWARKWTRPLKRGRVDFVLDGLRRSRGRLRASGYDVAALDELLGYLEPRREQLRYATARRRGFRIGSGRIEALVKQAVNLRLKRNGAWWNVDNAEAILALRVSKLTGQLDAVWARHVAATCRAVPDPLRSLMVANPLPKTLGPSPTTRAPSQEPLGASPKTRTPSQQPLGPNRQQTPAA